ncbi:FAD-dependent oxidoreductase [Pseudomonas sp.]|uniref:NAD(P)/FAD-dependent oxidoreductase n=1 Tax=Pseudomonas sp. TaxID=306 RepID=UPI0028A7671E|nr:FAD-dependent oxidoreductase [Pseudomonas sp.]
MEHLVIVGGGPAAHHAAKGFLNAQPRGRISLVSAERQLPYDRPQLSKGLLSGDSTQPLLLADPALHEHGQVAWLSGVTVNEIDRQQARVHLDDGRTLGYDKLLIATGSRVRRLPETVAQAPVHYLRTFEDALALRRRLVEGAHVVVIGGGFIGLEVAATARQRGCQVTVIEAQPRLLARSGCPALGEWAQGLHTQQGVDVQVGVSLIAIEPGPAGQTLVCTGAGTLTADVVVVGIGVQPNVELASACGLAVDDGIVVDRHCATQDPTIFAAGEVTRYPLTRLATHTRSESWTVAGEQGGVAGRAAAGDESAVYEQMPWLWSDQYSSTLQCLGLPGLTHRYTYLGDPHSDQWLALGWNAEQRLVCAIAANRNRDLSAVRRAIRRNEPLADLYTSTLASAPTHTGA